MIVWQGWGFLAALLPIVGYVLAAKLTQAAMGAAFINSHAWPGALGTLVGAAVVWFLALKLKARGRTLLDPATGQTVVLRKKNTLFFVPMEYVAIIMAVVALGMLIFRNDSPL